MLVTDQKIWDIDSFEAHVEGMCAQLRDYPFDRVYFWAHTTPEVIFLFFALWKLGKIACPLSPRLPKAPIELFTPKMPSPLPPKPWEWKEKNLATFLFTSGSSGTPKIACHTIANHLYNALGSNQLVPLEVNDRWLLSLPLNHVGGIAILFRCYLARASIVISSNLENITHLSLVPTQLQRYTSIPSVKYILLGGAPLPEVDKRVIPTYGMTEMSSQIVTGHKLHPYAEMKLAEDGEILVKGKTLFQGYLDMDLSLDKDGFFATKDLGRWNNGKFEVLGRKDNLFISGGENIQPEEIEQVLKKALPLSQAVVVPAADPEFGARPVVFLEPFYEIEAVKAALLPLLPKFKIPIRTYPLPTEEGLKPSRQKLSKLVLE